VRAARLIAEWVAFILVLWSAVFLTIALTLTFQFWYPFFYLKEKEIAHPRAKGRRNGLHRAGHYGDCD
jgi:hypothetical protein